MCGIHWQVAQATSLENIEFYMLFESDVPGNNQQVSPGSLTQSCLVQGSHQSLARVFIWRTAQEDS